MSEDEQASIRKELGEQPQSDLDLSELKAVIASVQKEGDIEQRLADITKRVFEEKSACENELSRLGRFAGTVESLLKVAMPVSETLDTFEKENDELAEKIRDHRRKQQEIEEEKKQAEQELKALLMTSDVPTISELEESRKVRNTGWSLVKRKYIEKIDVEQDIREFASESDLPTHCLWVNSGGRRDCHTKTASTCSSCSSDRQRGASAYHRSCRPCDRDGRSKTYAPKWHGNPKRS
jgi:vacuolar-type H+-ATPase subunit I/STV1